MFVLFFVFVYRSRGDLPADQEGLPRPFAEFGEGQLVVKFGEELFDAQLLDSQTVQVTSRVLRVHLGCTACTIKVDQGVDATLFDSQVAQTALPT